MRKTKRLMLLSALLIVLLVSLAQAGDKEDIEALIQQYSKAEDAGDMIAQAQLMTPDRMTVGIGSRGTDNVLSMKVQQENFDSFKKAFPGVKFYRDVRDLQIRLYGPTAVASFYWYTSMIIPGEMSEEKVKQLGSSPAPLITALVLVKQGITWKIAFTSHSPLYPPSSGQ